MRLASPAIPTPEAERQLARRNQSLPTPTGDSVAASSTGWTATAVASATPHTLGTWVQVVATTAFDTYGLDIIVTSTTAAAATDTSTLLNVSTGTAGNEATSIIIPNLAVGYCSARGRLWHLPVFIPSGSRLSIANQGAVASQSVTVVLTAYGRIGGIQPTSAAVVDLGTNTAASKGVTLTVPGGANSEGAWTQITAATTEPFRAIACGLQGGADTTLNSSDMLIDLAVGASSAETVIVPNIYMKAASSDESLINYQPLGAWPVHVPSGARIAARYQAASTANSVDVIVYGIR